ncbi:thiol reductant ABC exporter subunit CydC [Algiphilus sp.]|uniref:thiol reductant ABC exporter subunit CydC n=1 Tax=Algiphilus sp. TaxID=1872431 RepID=UPI003C6AAD8A
MTRPLRALLPYAALLRGRRGAAVTGALLLLATVVSAVALLGLSGWFITATGITALAWAAGSRVVFDIFLPGSGIRFFALSRTVARYFERLRQHAVTLDLLAALRTAVFARLARRPAATLAGLRDSVALDRLTSDVDAIDNLLLRVLSPLLVALLLPVATLASVTALLCLLALRAGMRPGRALRTRAEWLHVRILEGMSGLAELRAAGTLHRHAARTAARNAALAGAQRQRAHRLAALEAISATTVQLAGIGALLLGLTVIDGGMGAAISVMAALAILGCAEILPGLPQALYRLGETQTAASRLNALLDGPLEATPEATATACGAYDHALRLDGATVRYPHHPRPALADITLAIARGERVAIVGASGCGKSTLLQLIGGLYPAEAGAMTVLGCAADRVHPAHWRRRCGVLTQHSEIFAASVADNLRLGAPGADDAALWAALHTAVLDDVVAALPEGLGTWVGEHGARLSGGQARRLALARVLLRDPDLVVLDEPATGLDADTRTTLFARLDAWLAGRSALLLAHDPAALPRADRVLRLVDGRLQNA